MKNLLLNVAQLSLKATLEDLKVIRQAMKVYKGFEISSEAEASLNALIDAAAHFSAKVVLQRTDREGYVTEWNQEVLKKVRNEVKGTKGCEP